MKTWVQIKNNINIQRSVLTKRLGYGFWRLLDYGYLHSKDRWPEAWQWRNIGGCLHHPDLTSIQIFVDGKEDVLPVHKSIVCERWLCMHVVAPDSQAFRYEYHLLGIDHNVRLKGCQTWVKMIWWLICCLDVWLGQIYTSIMKCNLSKLESSMFNGIYIKFEKI